MLHARTEPKSEPRIKLNSAVKAVSRGNSPKSVNNRLLTISERRKSKGEVNESKLIEDLSLKDPPLRAPTQPP